MDLGESLRQIMEPLILDLLYRVDRLESESGSSNPMSTERLPLLKTKADQDAVLAVLRERIECLERRRGILG